MSWRRLLILSTIYLLAAGLSACRVTDKKAMSDSVGAVSTVSQTAGGDDFCAKRPDAKVCCEALTPACNECRDADRRVQDEWSRTCLASAPASPCSPSPPVIACCAEATIECAQCREAAFDELMRWKDACANIEAIRCDRQPQQTVCSAESIPSSESCLLRNRRMLAEWERRCRR